MRGEINVVHIHTYMLDCCIEGCEATVKLRVRNKTDAILKFKADGWRRVWLSHRWVCPAHAKQLGLEQSLV